MNIKRWLHTTIAKFLNQQHTLNRSHAKKQHYYDYETTVYELRPGDVILVEGLNKISSIIKRLTHSPWSHSVLYIGQISNIQDPQLREALISFHRGSLNEPLIIESLLGKGTIISPLANYCNDHIRICRPIGLTHKDAQIVIREAANTLGRNYDLARIIDFYLLFIFSRFLPKRWCQYFFLKRKRRNDEDICSAMIARAFRKVQFPILPLIQTSKDRKLEYINRNPILYTPKDFDYSPYFDIIKRPLMHEQEKALYRQLPWRSGIVSNDDAGLAEQSNNSE